MKAFHGASELSMVLKAIVLPLSLISVGCLPLIGLLGSTFDNISILNLISGLSFFP
jgi:hypothetical protein